MRSAKPFMGRMSFLTSDHQLTTGGELFGIGYLYAQSGDEFQPADLDVAIDKQKIHHHSSTKT